MKTKEKEIKDIHIKSIREIFINHRTSIPNVIEGINKAKEYLESNVEKKGLYKFASDIINFSGN